MSKTKPKRKPPVWRSVAAANAPDPRVPREHPEYGKRTVLAVFGVDSLGRTFRLDEDLKVVTRGTPPPANDEGG